MHIRKGFNMEKSKETNKGINPCSTIITGLGVGSIVFLVLHNIGLEKRITKISKSLRRFTNIVTETEEERQRYEFEQNLRLELLEDMMKDIYKDIEIYDGNFENIDGTEV